MNHKQQAALTSLRQAASAHHVDFDGTSDAFTLRLKCSCGWTHVERYQQNVMGRANKMYSAELRHLKDVVNA